MSVVEWVFWTASALVVYPYAIYPSILLVANRFGKREEANGAGSRTSLDAVVPDGDGAAGEVSLPSVTLIVSAFNEAAVIEGKLTNVLSLDYPSEALDVIVVSDGSTDSTAETVERVAATDARVRLLRLAEQSGKSAGLNEAVPLSRADIVVFSDANAMYQRDALRRLVAPFTDPRVGYTVGSALYREEDAEAVNVSEGLYWKYELWIKQLESRFHSVVGGDGAIYAIRRALYRPLARIDISDFVNPLQIVAAGYRGVFLPEARSHEGGTGEFADEFRRKRRIVNRSWGAVRRHIGLFSWRRHGRFLFMLISHKVIRWWSCAFVALALASGGALAFGPSPGAYPVLFAGIAGSVLLALVGWRLDRAGRAMPKLVYLPYYFYLVGWASLLGITDDFRGRTYATWAHVR